MEILLLVQGFGFIVGGGWILFFIFYLLFERC